MTSVSAGTRLGPHEVVSRVGAGGMGEVWKARDTRLDRSVAIKILPAALAADAQFRLRFEREAKTISQLNHPHICTLYDVGDDYLVMERLEGDPRRTDRARPAAAGGRPRVRRTDRRGPSTARIAETWSIAISNRAWKHSIPPRQRGG